MNTDPESGSKTLDTGGDTLSLETLGIHVAQFLHQPIGSRDFLLVPADVVPNVEEEEAADRNEELFRPFSLLLRGLGLHYTQ
jgi:hypothetical protein